jgi:hypothetical protein
MIRIGGGFIDGTPPQNNTLAQAFGTGGNAQNVAVCGDMIVDMLQSGGME